jgi:hypothetical protein
VNNEIADAAVLFKKAEQHLELRAVGSAGRLTAVAEDACESPSLLIDVASAGSLLSRDGVPLRLLLGGDP